MEREATGRRKFSMVFDKRQIFVAIGYDTNYGNEGSDKEE